MKKLLSLLAILAIAIGFVACDQDTVNQEESALELSDDTQVFTVEALSAASLLNYSSIETVSFNQLSDTLEEENLVEEEIDEIDKYLEMMETYLGDNDGLSVEVLESDKVEYENLVSFTTVDAYGNQVEYLLYYNETVYEEPVEEESTEETTEEPNGDFKFIDEDDEFVEYLLSGLIVLGEVEYEVEGKKITTEEGESITRLRAFLDSDNCVTVSYKVDEEDGNSKFFFQVKEDGLIVNKARVHVVNNEEGAKVVHLTFQDELQIAKYSFTVIESEGVTLIHIKYDIKLLADNTNESGNIHIEATLDPETGETVYEYKILGAGNGKADKVIEKRRGNPNVNQNRSNM